MDLEFLRPKRKKYWDNRCYICHKRLSEHHFHYQKICVDCGDYNYSKRHEYGDASNYVALVTGGRVKIGYETSLKLLRSGAFVIITTRFPIDAAYRFVSESDFEEWSDRLKIYKVDFRSIFQVERFIEFLYQSFDFLDIVINNAAQTVRKPVEYISHFRSLENTDISNLPENIAHLICTESLMFDVFEYQRRIDSHISSFGKKSFSNFDHYIENSYYGELEDHRAHNSWVARIDEVSTIELLEVQLINSVVPFILCSKLKPLMKRSPNKYRFIVNVSAMEGKFNKKNKNSYHPHTNMAKAALNMLTRTIANDFRKDNILVNSVDTGWITDENPCWIKLLNEKAGLTPPIDELDGASRICDPIFYTLKSNVPLYGKFIKNYKNTSW